MTRYPQYYRSNIISQFLRWCQRLSQTSWQRASPPLPNTVPPARRSRKSCMPLIPALWHIVWAHKDLVPHGHETAILYSLIRIRIITTQRAVLTSPFTRAHRNATKAKTNNFRPSLFCNWVLLEVVPTKGTASPDSWEWESPR